MLLYEMHGLSSNLYGFCAKQYVGNTSHALWGRISGHRNNTDSALKAHAIVHRDVFDNSFMFLIIVSCHLSDVAR